MNEDGREFVGTRLGFAKKYNVSVRSISGIASGRTKQTKSGWSVPDMRDKKSDIYKKSARWRQENNTKKYTFRTFDGRTFQGTMKSFCANNHVEMADARKIIFDKQKFGDWFVM